MARIRLAQIAADGPPPSGQVSIYAKTDNNLYFQTASGNEFRLNHSGIGGYKVEIHEIDLLQLTNQQIILDEVPTFPERTLFMVDGAPACFFSIDFAVAGNVLSWEGLRLDGLLELGDLVQVVYF